jgi:hypothetical protein
MAAAIKYEVERVDPRGEDVATKMSERLNAGGAKGWTLVNLTFNFSEILIFWQLPTRETRG